MSVSKDKIWKLVAPLLGMAVMLLIRVPEGMRAQAWHFFAVCVAMVVGMSLEPLPATAISFIAVTICVIGSNYFCLMQKSWPIRLLMQENRPEMGSGWILQHHRVVGVWRIHFCWVMKSPV